METDLITRLANKEPGALDEFYREYRGRIYAVARKFGRNDWDAEEIVQDVLWTVYRKAHTFQGDAAFSSWVYRVSENAARMHIRKHRRAPAPIETEILEAALESADDAPRHALPDEILRARRIVAELRAEFDQMDELNQQIFHGMDIENRSKEEVADDLGISISALKARLHRSRVRMREAAAQV